MAADHISIREKQQVLKLLAPALQAADPGIRELRLSADGSRVDIHTANGNVRPVSIKGDGLLAMISDVAAGRAF